MARKKKTAENINNVGEAIETSPTINASGIVYEGSVHVKIMKGNRTLKTIQKHNKGCGPLFDYIIRCLANAHQENFCPEYLMLYHNDETATETNLGVKTIDSVIYKSTYEVGSEGTGDSKYWFIRNKFVIPGGIFKQGAGEANVLALFCSANRDGIPSAFVQFPNGSGILPQDVTAGTSAIVVWELKFSNKVVS